jgi:hypothetical protein
MLDGLFMFVLEVIHVKFQCCNFEPQKVPDLRGNQNKSRVWCPLVQSSYDPVYSCWRKIEMLYGASKTPIA